MKTYQDFVSAPDRIDFIRSAISEYRQSDLYRTAVIADEYERQQNVTIKQFVRYLYTQDGRQAVDFTASNNRLCNNFFHRLNTQRCTYSLGNGVSFADAGEVDTIKEQLGRKFDNELIKAAYFALIHGVSYMRWDDGAYYVFPATEFCPLYDEYTGKLRAGLRFWSLDWQRRPVTVLLYTEDGYTTYKTQTGRTGMDLAEIQPQTAYKVRVLETAADGPEVVGTSNYGALPIVPLWGSKHRQSTLVGMRDKLDAYDLIQSGFANDLQDCAEIYWIIGNAMGMDDADLARFRDRLKLSHIAVADTENSEINSYAKDIPYAARQTFLENIRASIYEDFGALDVHTITAGQTNDHIEAGYQPLDEEADDFEYQIIQFVQQILALMGIDAVPQFKRGKVSNQLEQTQMIMMAAEYLDDETILKKLPFTTVDEVKSILKNRDAQELSGLSTMDALEQAVEEE